HQAKAERDMRAREEMCLWNYSPQIMTRAPRGNRRAVGRMIDYDLFVRDRMPRLVKLMAKDAELRSTTRLLGAGLANSWSVWIRDLAGFRPKQWEAREILDEVVHHLVGVHAGP